jgi:hypothetical protein
VGWAHHRRRWSCRGQRLAEGVESGRGRLDEGLDGELLCLLVGDDLDVAPLGALTLVDVGVEEGVEAEGTDPLQPALGVDEAANVVLDEERPQVLLPRPRQVHGDLAVGVRLEVLVRLDGAVVQHGPAHEPLLVEDTVVLFGETPHDGRTDLLFSSVRSMLVNHLCVLILQLIRRNSPSQRTPLPISWRCIPCLGLIYRRATANPFSP